MTDIAESYAAGTQALRDRLDAELDASEQRAEAAAEQWRNRRHRFVSADWSPVHCASCWAAHRGAA